MDDIRAELLQFEPGKTDPAAAHSESGVYRNRRVRRGPSTSSGGSVADANANNKVRATLEGPVKIRPNRPAGGGVSKASWPSIAGRSGR